MTPEEREHAVKCSSLHIAYLKCVKGNHLFSGRSCAEALAAYTECTKNGPTKQMDVFSSIGDAFGSLADAAGGWLTGGGGESGGSGSGGGTDRDGK